MDHGIAKLFIDGATCIAAVALALVTWQLVRVTRHHAHYAEQMAAAADRLGAILDRQGESLKEVAQMNTLVNAMAAVPKSLGAGGLHEELGEIIKALNQRRTESSH